MAWVEWDDRLRVRGFEDRVLWALGIWTLGVDGRDFMFDVDGFVEGGWVVVHG